MRILVIGGTRFVGRYVVEAALARGHEVTLVHRGGSADDPFPESAHLHLDRDGDLSALADLQFDATIDVCAYVPGQVHSLADALGDRAGRYVVVSSVSAYDVPAAIGFDETSALLPPASDDVTEVTNETYGPLKVSVELAARARFGDRATIVRPTYVIGPYDYTGRFTYWVQRIAEGGDVLAPGDPTSPMQVIDARDMGAWMVGLVERDLGGEFHAASPAPPYSFGDLLADVVAAVGPAGTTLTWAEGDWLIEQGENGATFPLWGEGDAGELVLAADPSAALATGLDPRPLDVSVRELLAHVAADSEQAPGSPLASAGPLSRAREAELLAAWRDRS